MYLKLTGNGYINNIRSTYEKLHLKYCKRALQVLNSSTGNAVRAELGRQPVFFDIIKYIVQYLIKLNNTDANTLLGDAFILNKELAKANLPSWYTSILNFSKITGIDIQNINSTTQKFSFFNSTRNWIDNQIINDFHIPSRGQDKNGEPFRNKLRTYKLVKNYITIEPYLTTPLPRRQTLISRFRLSSHDLQIEKGRHVSIPYKNRHCPTCTTGQIEDEYHFLIQCQTYNAPRQNLFKNIEQLFPEFSSFQDLDKFKFILKCPTLEFSTLFANFLKESFNTRDSLLGTRTLNPRV